MGNNWSHLWEQLLDLVRFYFLTIRVDASETKLVTPPSTLPIPTCSLCQTHGKFPNKSFSLLTSITLLPLAYHHQTPPPNFWLVGASNSLAPPANTHPTSPMIPHLSSPMNIQSSSPHQLIVIFFSTTFNPYCLIPMSSDSIP